MPLDKGKLQKLYSTLQQGGYSQSYDEFEKGFTGNDNYPNRKKVYDLLTEHGADIGNSYEDFMKKMYTPAASSPAPSYSQQRTQAPATAPKPQPKPAPKPKPRPKPKPKGGGMTAAERAQFIRNAQGIVHQSAAGLQRVKNQMDYANGNRGLKVRPVHLGQNAKVVRRHANGTVAKPRPVFDVAPEQQPGDTYLTESGNEYGSRAEADTEQNAVDQYRYDQSETGQLNNAYAEAERLDKLLEQRGKELDAENQDKWWRDLPRGGGGAVSTMNANDNNGRMTDTEYLNLLAARKKVDEQIRDLKAARDEKTGTFLGGLWRGFRDYAFDPSNWDNGYRDLLTTSAMLRAKTGAAKTPREKASERMMMEDTYKAGEAAQKAEKVLGNGYRFMRIGAQSLPFALQFMAGNAMGMTGGIARAGEGMGVKLARKIAIKQGANNMMRNIGRSVLKNTGVMLGDLGAATALTTTIQAGQTGADIGQRYAGDVAYDPTTDDYKLEGGKSLGRSIYEGVANSTIENYTEMLGEHMHLGKFASSALTKVGLGRVSNWFTKVGKTDFMQGVNKYMKMAGFNGYPQEVMEEEVGIPLHAIFDGGNKMSDLLDGRQQLDIVGGMLFSMAGMGGASMAMQGGHKAAMAVQYHQDQHKLDNADKVASFRLTADKWAPIKEEIDGTTNEDFGKTMKDVLSNDELSDQEKQAVWDYAQRLIIMRGHNMGQEAATRNGMTDKETNTANESYTQGYNTTDATAMNDAKNRLAAAQAKFDEAMKKEGVEYWEGEPSMQDIQHRHHDADEVLNMKWGDDGSLVYEEGDPIRKLAQDVVNAQQEYEGMMQRVRDDIDDEVQQTSFMYDQRTNPHTGMIQSATLKAQNPDGTDKKVYITSGNIVMTDDGKSVDRQKSDMSVVVVDDEGKVQMISPEDIFSLDTPIDGAQAKQQAIDAIQQSKAQEAADKINGKVNLAAGNTYTLTDSTGQQIEATIVADGQTGAVQNPDGTVNVSMNGKVVPMDVNTLQQMVDNTNMQRAAQGDEEDTTGDAAAMQQPTEPGNTEQTDDEGGTVTPEGAAVPTYPGSVVAPDVQAPHEWQVDDTFTIDNGGMPVRGQVTGVGEDGVEIYTESPVNGKKMQVVSPEELQSMTTEINGETVQGQEDAAAMQQPTQPVDGEQTGDNGSNGVNGEQPQGQAEPQQTEGQPQRAIDRIPSQQVDDGKGNVRTVHNWEQAEPGDTYDALTEIYHGNADRVKKGVQNRIGAIDKQIKSTQKQMDAIDNSDDFDAVAAQGEQYDQLQKQKEALEQQRKYWQSVQGVPQQRKLDEDKRTEEEKAAAKAAQEKAEAEAAEKARQEREQVNGVPDVVNDIPSDARKRGFRNVNGMVVNRQGETEGVTGRESNVKFSSTDTAKGKVKVIEADQLQPSHVNGQRNPQFFIDEAQPKDRTDSVSSMAAAKIASNLNPEEITGDGSAYQFSAPTVNSRGEVIQGNNRSDALKLMYSTPAFKPAQDAYKQYISDHAEEFGFTPEDVAKIQQMQHPVMVNELGVDDDEAIRLGQMKASDNESGGIERIDPVTTSQKLGAKVGSYANILLSSPDEDASLSDVLMQNGAKTVHWLSSNGIISNTAAQSALDRKGNLTPEARMDLLNILKQSLFQGGVSDLPTMFDKLPAKAQKAILNTFMRDFDSAESERILPEIQKAIEAWYGCAMSNEAFAKAPNYKAAKAAMHDWTLQTNLLDDNMPSDKFSNFAMELACRLQGCSMRETQQSLNDFFDLVQGKSQGDLFGGTTMGEQADRQESIRRIFNIEYKPISNNNGKTGSNAVADNGSQSGEGRQGSPTDGKGRERAESGSGSADGTGGTESHDEEVDDRGDSSHRDYSIHSGDSLGATSSSEKKETERQGVNTEPSEKQKEAGNYKKGHIKVDGFDITIENPKGSTRSGKDASGKAWSVPMHYDYGYIKGTEGVDGDHIDVYLSDDPTKGNVYVVDQIDQQTGKFDEHKVMYGFPSKEAAVEAYKGQYEKGWKVGPVTEVSREDFKKWVESSKRKTKPFSEYKSVKEAAAMQQPTQQSGSLALERRGTEHEALPTLKEPAVYKNNLAGGDAHVNIEGNPKSGYVVRYYDNKQEADINYPLAIGTEHMTAEQLADHLQKGDFTVAEQPTEPSTPTGTKTATQEKQPVRYGSLGYTLRPATQADFEGNAPFYVDGKQVHAVMLVRTGEQVSATQFSAPRVEAIYTTTNERIPVEKLEVEDVPKTVHLKTAGNFLEAYGNDAVALGRATGVTIIENDGQKMAGFPKNYLDEVEQNLRDAGFDVSVDGKATKAATDNIIKQLKGAPTAKTATAAIKNAMSGKKTEAKKNNEKKKVVSSQQKEKEPSLFDELFDDNSTKQKQAEDGLQRNDELRPEGLPSDSDHPGEHSERQGQGTSQGREGSDRERKGTGVRGVLSRNEQPVRSGERLNQHNNHAERGKDYAPTGVDDRIEANIAAIEMLHKITDEDRQATPSEMKVLRRFSGWGGLGKAFKEPEWGARNPYYNRLKALLSDEEWQEAEMSRNSAYFTPATVIDNLWDIARALGFKGGNVLEGSAGIGNIIGLMPTDMSERSHIQAVEIDSTTGGILRLLYPDAKTDIQGFEQTKVRNGSVDLAITNVPFVTGLHVNDTTGDKDLSRKFGDIHDFCIAKNVRKLKPGGIGIFITSSGTMDKSQKLRDWLVNDGDADVIGAFRMNNETFGGTSATSDIIVVRKRVDGKKSPMAIDVSKVGVERMGTYHDRLDGDKELPVDYNQYFIDHPENMGGKMYLAGEKGDTYRPSSKSLYPVGNISQKKRMEAWVKSLGDMYASAQRQAAEQGEDAAQNGSAQNLTDDAQENTVYDTLGDDVKEGSMLVDKQGRLCVATYGEAVPLAVNSNKVKGHTKVECFEAYKRIKDAVKKVLDYQTQHDDNKGLQPLLAELNDAYDAFVNTYGHLNKNTAISFLKNDMDFSGTAALEGFEEYNDKNGKRLVKYTKSDIFSQRVVEKESEPHPTTVKDGVITSIYKNGRIDLGYIAGELGKSREEVKQSILDEGLGFEDPVSGETVVSYEYLSGNVREKLHQAEAQNEGGRYDANIKALQKVIPMNIPSHLIEYSLGSSWLDPELYEQYIEEKTGIKVKARNIDGTWAVSAPSYGLSNEKNRMLGVTSSLVGKTVFGHELIIAAMKNTSIVVQKTEKSYDGHTETITDKEATRLCGEKIDEIRQDFKDWARGKMQQDPDLSKKYEERYNDQFNNYVPKEIPDSFVPMYFSGATHKIVLRPHQAKAAIRGTTQNVLLAHEVGSGKTFTLISTAMEMRRLGTARKPMVVVQNATVGQFVSSAKFLYPNAKILTIESKDRNAEGRKAFYAKIKYNDWDMVVIPQSVLDMIPDSEERQLAFVQAKIAEKEQVLRQMAEADVDDPNMMRRAQKELETLQEEMNTLSEQVAEKKKDSKKAAVARQNAKVRAEQMLDRKVDDVANFDDMGIDALLVDEAHEYKHLGFATAMQRGVKGVDPSYSKKCQGLYLKCQSVMEKTGGKNIIFATGTPISNTAAEIWTFMKYLMPEDMMKDYGIYYFDDFVRNFGDISQIPEFNTAGKFVQNNRFKGYQNLPELVRIWSGVSDTVLSSEIADLQAKIPQMQGGKAQDIYLPQTRALRSIMKYVRAQLKDYENMSGKEKKEHSALPLMMYGIAKAAAVDPRLVQSDAEDDEHSKTNACVRETLKALDESKKYQGTVAIFADNYQNKHSGFNLFDDIKEKLVKSGVPEKQIVVIKPGMTVEKKTAIFDKVNAGEVRVVLGTTATLGTGVNMQERLYTLIHLDAPNRPMDYTQRNGRILRQGNLHKEWNIPVKVIRFGVEDSLDVTAYQRLKTKGAIADSIMHGKDLMSNSMENRTIEEEEDQFGDTVAQLSGSEYALLKQQAERELRKYEGKKKQWEADQAYIHSQKPRLEGQIEAAKKRSRESANALDALSKSKEKGIVVGKKHFAGVDAMGDFIKDFNKKVKASEDDIRSHKSESADHVLDVTVDGHTFKVRLHLYKDMGESRGNLFEVVKRRMTYSCAELSLSDIPVKGSLLRNALEDIEQNVVTGNDFRDRKERAEAEADRLTKELTMIKSREGKQFEYGEQLEAAKQKVDEYTKKMKAELDEKEKKYAEMDKEVATSNLDDQSQDDDVLYRIEDDPEELDRLDKEPKVKVYRAMQLIDGKLYPPMAAKVNGSLVEPAEPGQWLRADEHPELAKNGLFTLNKGGKDASGKRLGSVPAAYNPYWHTSRSPLNDQFSSAYKRPNLVTVEVEIPKSELTSGYHADGAKDPVGEMSWHAGPVSSKLPKEKERKVILSRWCKVVRVVPDAEVADKVAGMLKGENISVPDNTITPSLRRELEKRGVPITHTKMVEDWERKYPSAQSGLSREGNGAYSDDELSMINDPFVKMLGEKARTAKQRKAFAARERRSMAAAVKELAEKLHLDNVEIRSAAAQQPLTEQATKQERRKARAKGYYDRKSGKIVINIDNHRDVEDAVQTLLHEAVAHYGLRQLFGSHFDTFLDNVYKAADMDVRQRITDLALRKYKGDFHVATEEYLASLAENTNFEHMPDSFWSKIKTLFLKMLHSIGFDGFAGMGVTLSDNELRYILWRSYENLKEPGRYRSILGEAEDVAKQAELKVGNYGVTSGEPRRKERGNVAESSLNGVSEPEAWGKNDLLSKAEQVSHGMDPGLLFRDTIEDDDYTARETYNRMADEKKNVVREAWQDSMINVRNLQQAVLEQRGEKLEDYEDAYNAENRSHGKSRAESEYFTDNLYKPLLKAVDDVAKAAKVSVGDVTEYMMAKHGLERNIVFARRDADAAYKKAYDEAKGKYDALMNASRAESDPKKADALEKAANKVKFPDYDDIFNHLRMRDYAGLTSLTGQSDVQDAEAEAQRIVADMESRAINGANGSNGVNVGSPIDELWKATNAATKWTLKKGYESGIISKDNYNYVSGMFNYYVPLRGWQEDTAGDLFDYVGSGDKGTAFSPTLHKAKGRRSEADNPIAYIGSMAVSAIVQGNKNKVKQTFLGFVENHPTNLVTVSEMWYRNYGTDTAPDWREDVPNIPEDATADEVADIVQQHEDLMEQLKDLGKATKKRGRLHLGVPVKRGQALEHHVEVMVNGKKYVLYINGNPRAAQALNGTRQRRASERSFESSKIARMGRLLAERYTSLSPSFTVSNALRDLTMAAITTLIKESPAYALRFRLNVAKLGGPARMFTLMKWYKKAAAQQLPTGQMNETEKYFYEFMTEGAETGFTSLKEIDEYKKDMDKMYRNMNQKLLNPKRLFRGLSKGLEYANRCIEDMTRFAIYMASRQSGRNVKRSVNDAKNVTLNFNRKGSGELGNATYRNLQIFVNPAIQSLQNVGKMAKDHPVRFSLLTGSIALIGAAQVFATQLLWSMFGGGDGDNDNWNAVDEYWKLPTWQRRNNLVMWIPGTKKFAMIPLAQEFRVFHGFGETLTTTLQGKSDESPALELMSQTADLLPLDFAGNNGNMLVNLAPTVVQPLLQVRFNTDFTGRPLYKDTGFNKYEPSFQKAYVGTPSWLVKSSEFLNDLTGGDDHKQGWWERTNIGQYANNPAVVDHLLKGYYGGMYSFFAQTGGAMLTAASGKLPDVQEVPVANRVVTAVRETEQSGKQKLPDWYYELSEENARHQNEFSGYKKDYMTGDADGKKKFNALIKSKDFAKWQEVNTYIGAVQQIRTAMSYTKDPAEKAELQKNLDEVLAELKKLKDK